MFLLYYCISYILGIIWGLNQTKFGLVPLFFMSISLVIFILFFRNNNKRIIFVVCTFLILFGYLYFSYRDYNFRNKYDGEEKFFSGYIDRFICETENYNKYIFINDYNDKFLLYLSKDENVKENDIIEFKGKFEHPSSKRNKGGYDYSNYLYSQNIYGSIFCLNNNIQVVGTNSNFINDIRNSIINILGQCFPKKQFSIALGMFIGDTSYLSDEIEDAFKSSRNNSSFGSFRQ